MRDEVPKANYNFHIVSKHVELKYLLCFYCNTVYLQDHCIYRIARKFGWKNISVASYSAGEQEACGLSQWESFNR